MLPAECHVECVVVTQHGCLHKYKVTAAGQGGVAGPVGACVGLLGASHDLHVTNWSISIKLQVQIFAGSLMIAAGPGVSIAAAAVRVSQPRATVPEAAYHENNKGDEGNC